MIRLETSLGIALVLCGVALAACAEEVVGIPEEPEPEPALQSGTPKVAAEPPPPLCSEAAGSYTASREPTNVLFLLDRSGSMHIQLPTKTTRWDATKKGFFDLLGVLPESTGAGLMLFPQGDAPVNKYCGIDASVNDVRCSTGWPEPADTLRCDATRYVPSVIGAPLGTVQVDLLKQQILASDKSFFWGTPLASALTAAITSQKASTLPGARSVILLTDGNPTSCQDSGISNDIANVVAAAKLGTATTDRSAPVRTFVIGLTDSSRQAAKASNLSPIAVAGGTKRTAGCEANNECFYKLTDANFAADLKKVFEEVTFQAFDCTFNLPEATAGADPSLVNVQQSDGLTTHTLSRDPEKKEGWDYLENGKQIQLYGQACRDMKNAKAELNIVLGCKTIPAASQAKAPSVE